MGRIKITCVWGMRLCSPFLENASGKMGLYARSPWPPFLSVCRCSSCHVFHPQVGTCCCVSPCRIPISLGELILPSTFSALSFYFLQGDSGPALAKHLTLTFRHAGDIRAAIHRIRRFLQYTRVWWVPAPIDSDPVS